MTNALRYPGQWTIDADTLRTLELFAERVEEFRTEGSFRYPVKATIGIRDGGEPFSEAELPTEKQLRAAAQIARHFILEKEPLHFGGVCNLLYRSAVDARFRDEIARVRKIHNEGLKARLSWRCGEPDILTRRALIQAFFNGHYFHSDPEPRALVQSQNASAWGPLFKQEFAHALLGVYQDVRALLPVVENALGVDQLARCATSKRIQIALAEQGLGPTAITIAECPNGATSPPTVGLRCELDLHVPDESVAHVAGAALAYMRNDRPGFPEYALWWRASSGRLQGVVHATALPEPSDAAEPPPDSQVERDDV